MAELALHPDLAAMGLHDLLDDGQAQPGAGLPGRGLDAPGPSEDANIDFYDEQIVSGAVGAMFLW